MPDRALFFKIWDAKLKGKSHACLIAMQRHGYINVVQIGDDYKIDFKERGPGGGPLFGWIGYWGTKAVCYGTVVAATGTLVVTSGGTLGAAMGATVAAGTAGATTGATIVAGAIAGGGLAAEAAVLTGGTVAAAGGAAGVIAGIESASGAIGALLLACPFLP